MTTTTKLAGATVWLTGLPSSGKTTLAFALAMALVLAATGVLLYTRLGTSLDVEIDNGLRTHAATVAALVQHSDQKLTDTPERAADPDHGSAHVPAGRRRALAPGAVGGRPCRRCLR